MRVRIRTTDFFINADNAVFANGIIVLKLILVCLGYALAQSSSKNLPTIDLIFVLAPDLVFRERVIDLNKASADGGIF